MSFKIVYEAEITGDSPPYKWVAYQREPTVRRKIAEGEAETFDDAKRAARDFALDEESQRRHAATKEMILLFEADAVPARTDVGELERMVDG